MVNLKAAGIGLLLNSTMATAVAVASASLSAIALPVGPVVGLVAPAPRGAIVSAFVFGLPKTHASGRAEVSRSFLDFGGATPEAGAALVAMHELARPSEYHEPAFSAASNCLYECLPIRPVGECLATDWTWPSDSGSIEAGTTGVRTKPVPRFAASEQTGQAVEFLPARFAVNLHAIILPHFRLNVKMIAAEQFTGKHPVLESTGQTLDAVKQAAGRPAKKGKANG